MVRSLCAIAMIGVLLLSIPTISTAVHSSLVRAMPVIAKAGIAPKPRSGSPATPNTQARLWGLAIAASASAHIIRIDAVDYVTRVFETAVDTLTRNEIAETPVLPAVNEPLPSLFGKSVFDDVPAGQIAALGASAFPVSQNSGPAHAASGPGTRASAGLSSGFGPSSGSSGGASGLGSAGGILASNGSGQAAATAALSPAVQIIPNPLPAGAPLLLGALAAFALARRLRR